MASERPPNPDQSDVLFVPADIDASEVLMNMEERFRTEEPR